MIHSVNFTDTSINLLQLDRRCSAQLANLLPHSTSQPGENRVRRCAGAPVRAPGAAGAGAPHQHECNYDSMLFFSWYLIAFNFEKQNLYVAISLSVRVQMYN